MHHFLSYFLPARAVLLLARRVALVTSESSQTSLCSGLLGEPVTERCYFILPWISQTCTLFFSCCTLVCTSTASCFVASGFFSFFGLSEKSNFLTSVFLSIMFLSKLPPPPMVTLLDDFPVIPTSLWDSWWCPPSSHPLFAGQRHALVLCYCIVTGKLVWP